MKQKVKYKGNVILWVIVAALMVGIFYMSSQPANESNDTSYKLIGKIAYIVYPEYRHLTLAEKEIFNSRYNHLVRKITHATVYFFLAIFSLAALGFSPRLRKSRIELALIICLLFAISDELHQWFVPGRSPQLTDVLIDLAGILLAILIYLLACQTRRTA